MTRARRPTVVLATVLVVLVLGPAVPATAQPPPPDSMASMGDSITRGFNACGFYLDCTSRSFSTGGSGSVDSHYRRIRAIHPAIDGNNFNAADSGARVHDLPAQAEAVVARDVDYVTILIGGNDACTDSEASMTPVSDYRARLDEALALLRAGLPDADVLLISVPDLRRLWEVGRGNIFARLAWSLFDVCQSMLANPTSLAPADVQRRERVRQRIIDYNTQLAEACAAYGPRCRFDDNAVFDYRFTASDVSNWDFFHPSRAGQAALAELTYQAGFRW